KKRNTTAAYNTFYPERTGYNALLARARKDTPHWEERMFYREDEVFRTIVEFCAQMDGRPIPVGIGRGVGIAGKWRGAQHPTPDEHPQPATPDEHPQPATPDPEDTKLSLVLRLACQLWGDFNQNGAGEYLFCNGTKQVTKGGYWCDFETYEGGSIKELR